MSLGLKMLINHLVGNTMSNLQQRPLVRNPYKPYQFNHLITFCDSQNTINQAGINVTKLVPAFSLHFAYIKQTITQKYQLIGTDLETLN